METKENNQFLFRLCKRLFGRYRYFVPLHFIFFEPTKVDINSIRIRIKIEKKKQFKVSYKSRRACDVYYPSPKQFGRKPSVLVLTSSSEKMVLRFFYQRISYIVSCTIHNQKSKVERRNRLLKLLNERVLFADFRIYSTHVRCAFWIVSVHGIVVFCFFFYTLTQNALKEAFGIRAKVMWFCCCEAEDNIVFDVYWILLCLWHINTNTRKE